MLVAQNSLGPVCPVPLTVRGSRAAGDVPTTIGFGVSMPDHVRSFAPLADGVVVGSALIRALNEGRSPYERRNIARTFVGRLAAATWAPRAGGF